MSANPNNLPVIISVKDPGVGVTLYKVDQVRQPTGSDPKIHKAQAQQIQSLAAQAEFAGFLSYWREVAGVKTVNPLKQASASSGS
jgi:hypothetical protein